MPEFMTPFERPDWVGNREFFTDEERKAFKQLASDDERQQFIEQFWLRRDPTPDTEENEYREEHYRRIAYANERFASGIPGWKSDRSRIYIAFGPPYEIEAHPSGDASRAYPFERWRYGWIERAGSGVIIEFSDSGLTGEYRLTMGPTADVGQAGALPVHARVYFFPLTEATALTIVAVQLENKDLPFQDKDGMRRAVVNMYGRITTVTRRATNAFEDTITVDSPADLRHQKSFHLPPGYYRLNLVLKDATGGVMNNLELALDVPRIEPGRLASSTLVLADSIEKAPTGSIVPARS